MNIQELRRQAAQARIDAGREWCERQARRDFRGAADRSLNQRPEPTASVVFPVIVDGAEAVRVRLIYGLVDPLEPGRIRYVGKTTCGALSRYVTHLGSVVSDATGKADWWLDLLGAGRYPNMVLLETVDAGHSLDACELWWIGALQARGEADLNVPRARSAKRRVATA